VIVRRGIMERIKWFIWKRKAELRILFLNRRRTEREE
tara:strand:+ start:20 stop:130 length:111 start_codon:yes stop_codon:yes gene_type:complete